MRKKRKGEYTCRCDAYRFPHRFGGGSCCGFSVVEETWESNYGQGVCADCHNLNQTEEVPYCEVIVGQERTNLCPAWQEFVNYEEIKI